MVAAAVEVFQVGFGEVKQQAVVLLWGLVQIVLSCRGLLCCGGMH